jgi:hypothetical protein
VRTFVTGAGVIRLFVSGNDPQPLGQDAAAMVAVEAVRGAEDEPTRVGAAIAAAGIAMMATAARIVL